MVNNYSLFNVLIKFIQSAALSKYILSYSSGTPGLAIKVGFYLYQHRSA